MSSFNAKSPQHHTLKKKTKILEQRDIIEEEEKEEEAEGDEEEAEEEAEEEEDKEKEEEEEEDDEKQDDETGQEPMIKNMMTKTETKSQQLWSNDQDAEEVEVSDRKITPQDHGNFGDDLFDVHIHPLPPDLHPRRGRPTHSEDTTSDPSPRDSSPPSPLAKEHLSITLTLQF